MLRSHKIRIYPSPSQEKLLVKASHVARFTYNLGLEIWNKQSARRGESVTYFKIKKLFNAIKHKRCSWVTEVSKCVPEYALSNLNAGFQKFFKKTAKHPRFHKRKSGSGSFSISNDKARVEEFKIMLPKIGPVNMAEKLRYDGKILKYTVSTTGGRWFVSISVEVPEDLHVRGEIQAAVGIDLGIKDTVTLSDGRKMSMPDLVHENRRILRLQKDLARKVKGSENFKKNVTLLQTAYYRKTSKKLDWVHKITTSIAREFSFVAVEDLNVSGMLRNHKLASKIANSNWSQIKELLTYKADKVVEVDRWFPSSKVCSACGVNKEDLILADREWTCSACGVTHDRDVNAAKNLLRWATPELTSVDKKPSGAGEAMTPPKVLGEAEMKEHAGIGRLTAPVHTNF